MILLRGARHSDLDSMLRLAHVPGMFNLPSDREALKDRIQRSIDSFSGKSRKKEDAKYTFVAEDLETQTVLATSMIAGQHGTPDSPHFYFQVGHERRFSETINTGFIHGTLTLAYDTEGPSEIGALVVDPEARNHSSRLGRQISFVRFLYAGLNRSRFQSKIIAELLPPLNKRGLSPLWEAIGRRFTNMDYWEADQLCSKNKDFIFDLFPSGKIYTTFLSAEARNAIGKVGKETEPVLHMLKKIGFEYKNQVDPFDGGPHLWAETDKILPIRNLKKYRVEIGSSSVPHSHGVLGLLCPLTSSSEGEFRAISVEAERKGTTINVNIPPKWRDLLGNLQSGDEVAFMPFYTDLD